MNRFFLVAAVSLAAIGAGAWWFTRADASATTGVLRLQWRGSHRGEAVLPGQVAWCPVTRMATLEAISNDTGLLVTLLEPDSLAAAPHPVVAPEVRGQAPRPSAIVALRWASDSGDLMGYRSVSGLVNLTRAGTRASGSLEVRMRMPVGFDTLVAEASFENLPVVASAVGCP